MIDALERFEITTKALVITMFLRSEGILPDKTTVIALKMAASFIENPKLNEKIRNGNFEEAKKEFDQMIEFYAADMV